MESRHTWPLFSGVSRMGEDQSRTNWAIRDKGITGSGITVAYIHMALRGGNMRVVVDDTMMLIFM